jgi:hypothetical protein
MVNCFAAWLVARDEAGDESGAVAGMQRIWRRRIVPWQDGMTLRGLALGFFRGRKVDRCSRVGSRGILPARGRCCLVGESVLVIA